MQMETEKRLQQVAMRYRRAADEGHVELDAGVPGPVPAVVHVKDCEPCGGEGQVEGPCRTHGDSNCPCVRRMVECGECDGSKVRYIYDCECNACCDAQEDLELYLAAPAPTSSSAEVAHA